jgi:hypothetical protein
MRSPLTARRIGLLPSVSSQASQASTKGALPAGLTLAVKRSHQNRSIINDHRPDANHIDNDQAYDVPFRRTTSCGRVGEVSMIATLTATARAVFVS